MSTISNQTLINGALVLTGAAVNIYYSWPKKEESFFSMKTARIALGTITSMAYLALNEAERSTPESSTRPHRIPTSAQRMQQREQEAAASRIGRIGSTRVEDLVAHGANRDIILDDTRGIIDHGDPTSTTGIASGANVGFIPGVDILHMVESRAPEMLREHVQAASQRSSQDPSQATQAMKPTEWEITTGQLPTHTKPLPSAPNSSDSHRGETSHVETSRDERSDTSYDSVNSADLR